MELLQKTLEIVGEVFVICIAVVMLLIAVCGGSISITISGISRFFK